MSVENPDQTLDNEEVDSKSTSSTSSSSDSSNNSNNDPVEKLVQSRLDEALKDIKQKLDKAYSVRDEALKKAAELDQARKQEEIKRLQDEGKHKEALEAQLAEEKAQRAAAEERLVKLTRDLELRNALSSYPFKNDNALSMAYREIVDQLAQDERGVWKHKSGVPLKDFVKQFVDSEENAFLLKTKASSGAGSSTVRSTDTSSGTGGKSIFAMSQDEVLKLVREGKLKR